MKDIMIKLFEEYNFIKTWEENNKMFFVNADKNIVSYFILDFIDCTHISDDEELIKKELSKLEEEYIDSGNEKKGIKYSIISSFENKQEVSQIDKNTSAIYLVEFSEINMLSKYRNLIYSIEESPDYFKRYILPYTEKQVAGLKNVLADYSDKNIGEILSQLADVEENYYSLMNGTNNNSVYELVIRLFSNSVESMTARTSPLETFCPVWTFRDIRRPLKWETISYSSSGLTSPSQITESSTSNTNRRIPASGIIRSAITISRIKTLRLDLKRYRACSCI